MTRRVPLAWLQITREKLRLAVALAGVAFAVILVSMQLGFRGAVYDSAVRYHRAFAYDLAMVSPKTPFIGFPEPFSRRRLWQTLGAPEVESVAPVYLQQGFWKNPWTNATRNILVVGIDPARPSLDLPGVQAHLHLLRLADVGVFDARSRPEYGPVAQTVHTRGVLPVELNDRRIDVLGLFRLGTSFGVDGSLVTSDLNFQRLFPDRRPGLIDLGLIRLRPGADPLALQRRLARVLEGDVLILTRGGFVAREMSYWATTTPIGYVFGFGAIMGLIVGSVIVYQILFADVSEHQAEYATLKAMGYTDRHLSWLVLQQAGILAVLGFLPGLAISVALYDVTADATRLPLAMSAARASAVFGLTLAMCAFSALVALRRVHSTDPAEVFA